MCEYLLTPDRIEKFGHPFSVLLLDVINAFSFVIKDTAASASKSSGSWKNSLKRDESPSVRLHREYEEPRQKGGIY